MVSIQRLKNDPSIASDGCRTVKYWDISSSLIISSFIQKLQQEARSFGRRTFQQEGTLYKISLPGIMASIIELVIFTLL